MDESRRMVLESLRREEEDAQKAFHELEDEIELPDDDDSNDQEKEYEHWKERELKRIWRDHSQELEKEGLVSPWEEKEQEAVSVDNDASKSSTKSSYRYLQKYYHKGAFFQETLAPGVMKEDIYNRDFNEATGEDRMDRTVLPDVMQVRKYGFASQTKHRHLLEDDTSDKSHPWFKEQKHRDKSLKDGSEEEGRKHR
jgi:microfibrillar-associated protein 1